MERADIEQFLANTSFMDLALGGQSDKFAHTLCIKRPEFSHENEVRLLFYDTENNKGVKRVASFAFEPINIISEVALDPRMLPDEFEVAKEDLIRCGCTLSISQSDLYKINETIIRLD
jgi:hypothetical protein